MDPDEARVSHDSGDDATEGEDDEPNYGHCYGVCDAHFAVVVGDIVVRVVVFDCVCCAGEGGGLSVLSCREVLNLFGRCAGCWRRVSGDCDRESRSIYQVESSALMPPAV